MDGCEESEIREPLVSLPGEGAIRVLDGRSRILVDPRAVGDRYAMLEQTIPPGVGPPFHVHRHETEIFYVIEGLFEFRVADRSFPAPPGTNVLGPRGIPHTFRNVGDTEARLLLTIYPGAFGHYFIAVDGLPDSDRAAIRRLAASFGVDILE